MDSMLRLIYGLLSTTMNPRRQGTVHKQLTTWGFSSETTTSDASVAAAITKPAKPYPDPTQ